MDSSQALAILDALKERTTPYKTMYFTLLNAGPVKIKVHCSIGQIAGNLYYILQTTNSNVRYSTGNGHSYYGEGYRNSVEDLIEILEEFKSPDKIKVTSDYHE